MYVIKRVSNTASVSMARVFCSFVKYQPNQNKFISKLMKKGNPWLSDDSYKMSTLTIQTSNKRFYEYI